MTHPSSSLPFFPPSFLLSPLLLSLSLSLSLKLVTLCSLVLIVLASEELPFYNVQLQCMRVSGIGTLAKTAMHCNKRCWLQDKLNVVLENIIHLLTMSVSSDMSCDFCVCANFIQYNNYSHKQYCESVMYRVSPSPAGSIHPSVALRQYREFSGIDARLIVCGMASNGFTIADPNDAGMLDMAGFDSAAPEIIRNFALGEI